jgi:type II restriction/modification system DNA methylase subunit YeeA
MDTNKLKKFAQDARTLLIAQVTSKLGLVLADGSAARREAAAAVRVLEAEIKATSEKQVVEKVAYTWFNRFTALRFMDANGYTNPRIVTPADGQTRPEILADAAAGHMPDDIPDQIRNAVTALLDGRTPSRDAQGEAYRLLLVAGCNQWHGPMPFLFETIADYTELLMPEDLLSETSILASLRKAMTDDDCKDVEIIGWLYQFYISEKKDQVFAGLKKNIKITAENIPAATQLFTPHWIVRYLVENSLGRLWLLNRPQSKLAAQMDYYIAPEEPETDFLRITRPEDIRICDPAAGSGHMLTYAFDLLHAIYEEEGYEPTEIPALILTHNLHGVEIDDRAGALAAFALVMKAAAKLGRRRFLRLGVQPNICVMQDVRFTPAEMQDVAAVVGRDLFTAALRETLGQFEQAKNFGSLIVPKLRDPAEVTRVVRLKDFGGDLLLREVQERVLKVLEMAEALSPKYHVVVANPPYMGSSGMNSAMQDFSKSKYPDSKADLFAMFMERTLSLLRAHGFMGMINMQAWMFLSSYEKLRGKLLDRFTLVSMAHLGTRGFDTIAGEVVSTTAFVFSNARGLRKNGTFLRLTEGRSEGEKSQLAKEAIEGRSPEVLFLAAAQDFLCIPGAPVAYWIGPRWSDAFRRSQPLGQVATASEGIKTGNNERFLRFWFEVQKAECREATTSNPKWAYHLKGGEFRRWHGNCEYVILWKDNGRTIKNQPNSGIQGEAAFNRDAAIWSDITSGGYAARLKPKGYLFDSSSPAGFLSDRLDQESLLGFLNSAIAGAVAPMLNPTLHFKVGNFRSLPYEPVTSIGARRLIAISKSDWDAYETSWDFTTLPLLAPEHRDQTLAGSYARLRSHWQGMTDEMQRLEEENNRIFIDAYGLQDELTPEVPLEEITLTCNPAYRYGGKATVEELETRLRADTMAEFLHYAVGCMFGRYSLDAPGLILANQGEGLADYLARIPEPSFDVDADNVIPVLDADWFADDITERFRKFLRVTFGEAQFQENLAFIEDALGKDIRKYFTKDFFEAHVRRYKKRPIYWMFSSPKGTFNALIYMHRYRPDTVSVVLNDYLREFISKLQSERLRLEKLADDMSASQSQRTKALKDVAVVAKQLDELTAWERDVVFPLAQAKIEIDLDDGVKANYPKFGAALKFIKGLEASEDE